jgi:ribose 5-phosphate isomerase A
MRTGNVSMKADSSDTSAKPMTQDELKKLVGYKSVDDYVKSGMVVGLGTGSTAYFAVERVG